MALFGSSCPIRVTLFESYSWLFRMLGRRKTKQPVCALLTFLMAWASGQSQPRLASTRHYGSLSMPTFHLGCAKNTAEQAKEPRTVGELCRLYEEHQFKTVCLIARLVRPYVFVAQRIVNRLARDRDCLVVTRLSVNHRGIADHRLFSNLQRRKDPDIKVWPVGLVVNEIRLVG